MKLVVGLGNPGAEYRGSRHNVGFLVADRFAQVHHIAVTRTRFRALVGDGVVGEEKVVVAKPQTYMNLSGGAVGDMVAFYKVEPRDLLVVCDDIALPLGRLRLREAGSSGGQKGLDSILQRLGRRDVPRLRLGIGEPPGRMDATDYVLGHFSAADREEVALAVEDAALAIEVWIREGSEVAMSRFNGPREKTQEREDEA